MLQVVLAVWLALGAWAFEAAAASIAVRGEASPSVGAASLGITCNTHHDGGPALRRALGPGGEAAGRTLLLPSGCKVLVGSPGSGRAVASLASGTTLRCEDQTAGLVLARRACSGGDLAGAACTDDEDCGGGRCSNDGDASGAFAPETGATYTVLAASPGARDVALLGCGIWTQQQNADSSILGGSGNAVGYCVGGTNHGRACKQTCSHAPQVACDDDRLCAQLAPGSTCMRLSDCTAAPVPGRCVATPAEVHRSPAGPGKIHPVDFAGARRARIEGVRVYDHRRGDFSVRTGLRSTLIGSSNLDGTGSGLPTAYAPNEGNGGQACVGTGAVVQYGSRANANEFFGWDAAFRLEGSVKASDNQAGGLGRETYPSWKGTVGFLLYGAANELRGNSLTAEGGLAQRYGTPFICIAPYVGEESTGSGFNFLALGMLSGTTSCIADGEIGRGVLLEPSDAVPGSVRASSANGANGAGRAVVGSALEAAASGDRFRCLIGQARVVPTREQHVARDVPQS